MTPLRILILADPYSKPSFAPRLRFLCDYLAERGHFIEVYTEAWDTIPFPHSYPIHEIPLMRGGSWALKSVANLLFDWKSRVFTRSVREVTSGKDYNLIFCTTFSTFPLTTALTLARERHLPLITDIRDLDEQVPGAQYQHHRSLWLRPFRALYSAIERRRRNRVLRLADHITTISPWHKEFLRRFNPQITLIYNGFDPAQFYPEDIPTDTFRIAYIGRIYEFQDLSIIRECVRELDLPRLSLELHTPDHDPLPLTAVGNAIRRASLMLVLTNTAAHGMMTTKFYEALGCEKPVLLIPDDHGLLAETIRRCNAGLASSDKEEIKDYIRQLYTAWTADGYTRQLVRNKDTFNRQTQARQFELLFYNSALL